MSGKKHTGNFLAENYIEILYRYKYIDIYLSIERDS